MSVTTQVAFAQEGDVAAAAAAFSRAQEAEVRGETAQAADLYEMADRISPAPAALRSATRSRLAAGQLASAATDAEELKRRYPTDRDSVAIADEVLAQASQKLARLSVQCQPACRLVIDGLAASTDTRLSNVAYVEPGTHTVVGRFADGSSKSERVDGAVGQQISVELVAPPAPPPAPPPSAAPVTAPPVAASADLGPAPTHGLSPAVGIVVGGAALALGGVAIWSAIDTKNARDDFDQHPTRDAFDAGQNKDLRTNILIGASAAVGVASVAILAFATDWSGGSSGSGRASLHLVASPTSTGLSMRGSF